jgi:hypothetical protein
MKVTCFFNIYRCKSNTENNYNRFHQTSSQATMLEFMQLKGIKKGVSPMAYC